MVTDNKFDFYNITEIADKKYMILDRALKRIVVSRMFTIYQLVHFLIKELEKHLEKYKSKLLVITGDFFLSDSQITNQDNISDRINMSESKSNNTLVSKNQDKNETKVSNITDSIDSSSSFFNTAAHGSQVTSDFNGDGYK